MSRTFTTGLLTTGLLTAAGALLLGLATAAPASAADAPSISIAPVGITGAYFTVPLAPGGSGQITVELANKGDGPAEARTYAADAYTRANGGFAARPADAAAGAVTSWLAYPSDTIRLAGGERVRRTVTVSVPTDAAPGEHVTSLIVEHPPQPGAANASTNDTGGGGGITLAQSTRQALPVVIDVAGPHTPKLAIGAAAHVFAGPRSVVSVAVTNPGNVRIHPRGRFVITAPDGREAYAGDVKMDTVFPGDATTIEANLTATLTPGHYPVTVELTDDLGVSAAGNNLFIDVPAPDPEVVPASRDSGLPSSDDAVAAPAATATASMTGVPPALVAGLLVGAMVLAVAGTLLIGTLRRRTSDHTADVPVDRAR